MNEFADLYDARSTQQAYAIMMDTFLDGLTRTEPADRCTSLSRYHMLVMIASEIGYDRPDINDYGLIE